MSEQQYRPGDVVNGHVLNESGTQWIPIAPADPPAQVASPNGSEPAKAAKRGKQGNKKWNELLAMAGEHLDGEPVLATVAGAYETKLMGNDHVRNGALIATDRRLVFFAKTFTGFHLESFPYANISSFEQGQKMMGQTLTFFASGNKVLVKWIHDPELPEFVRVVRRAMESPAPTAASPQAPADDPMAQLVRLGQLRDSGLITTEEFEAKRQKLVALI